MNTLSLEQKISKRLESNLEILDILRQQAENNPGLRFTQLLWATGIFRRNTLGIEDTFYEESVDTLENLKNR